MITFSHKGSFSNFEKMIAKGSSIPTDILRKYGEKGVAALKEATPKDTGKTSESWDYKISKSKQSASITFTNSNTVNGTNIAIIIQYGHTTGWGSYVKGIDYINPALRPVFDDMTKELWREVTNK